MTNSQKGLYVLVGLTAVAAAVLVALPPIPQDLAYHNFADQRRIFGVSNLFNVVSNLPFVVIGMFGLYATRDGLAGRLLTAGIVATGFGSAWYHWAPSNATLVWDRVPMTGVFMSLLSIIIGDRVDKQLGRVLLLPLIVAGIASVAYWRLTDDLRFYGIVQFFPVLAIAALIVLLPGDIRKLTYALLWYGVAKASEFLDTQVFSLTGGDISGHSLKHLASSVAALYILMYILGTYPYIARRSDSAIKRPIAGVSH